jgi:hypothetical protein
VSLRTRFNRREAEIKCGGIDLHSNHSVVTVTDEDDHVVVEKRLPNDLAMTMALLVPWRDELAGVVVESTFNWYWLVDGLEAAGFNVQLANTTAIKKYDDRHRDHGRPAAHHVEHRRRLGSDAPHRRADDRRHDLLDAADADRDSGALCVGEGQEAGQPRLDAVLHSHKVSRGGTAGGERGHPVGFWPQGGNLDVSQAHAKADHVLDVSRQWLNGFQ